MAEDKAKAQLSFMKRFCDAKIKSLEERIKLPVAEIAVLTDLLMNSKRWVDDARKTVEVTKLEAKKPDQNLRLEVEQLTGVLMHARKQLN